MKGYLFITNEGKHKGNIYEIKGAINFVDATVKFFNAASGNECKFGTTLTEAQEQMEKEFGKPLNEFLSSELAELTADYISSRGVELVAIYRPMGDCIFGTGFYDPVK